MITFEDARQVVAADWPDYDLAPWGFEGDEDWFVLLLPETVGGRIAAVDKQSGELNWINENADEYTQERPAGAPHDRNAEEEPAPQAITWLRPDGRVYKRDERGRFGSGGGSGATDHHAEIDAAVTTFGVSDAAERALSSIVGDKVKVSFEDLDIEVARGLAHGLIQGAERYPATPLREVGTYAPSTSHLRGAGTLANQLAGDSHVATSLAVAIRGGETDHQGGTYQTPSAQLPNGNHTGGTAIYANAAVLTHATFATINSIRDLERAGTLAGRGNVSNGSATEVALHEFAHATGYHGRPYQPEYAAGKAIDAIAQSEGVAPSEVAGRISRYAKTNTAELAAEAFADVMVNGDKAAPESHAAFDAYDESAQGWTAEVAPK